MSTGLRSSKEIGVVEINRWGEMIEEVIVEITKGHIGEGLEDLCQKFA